MKQRGPCADCGGPRDLAVSRDGSSAVPPRWRQWCRACRFKRIDAVLAERPREELNDLGLVFRPTDVAVSSSSRWQHYLVPMPPDDMVFTGCGQPFRIALVHPRWESLKGEPRRPCPTCLAVAPHPPPRPRKKPRARGAL